MIQYLNKENFNSTLANEKLVLVDFYADWCGPCQAIHPVLEELANELQNQVLIAKVNVDQDGELAGAFGIRSIPTMILFKQGNPVDTIVGLQSKSHLTEAIAKQLDQKETVTN